MLTSTVKILFSQRGSDLQMRGYLLACIPLLSLTSIFLSGSLLYKSKTLFGLYIIALTEDEL